MSEGASQLTIIVSAFVLTFALVGFTRFNPIALGCLVPVVAGVAVWIWLLSKTPQSSTESLAVPFMVIFAAMGSLPGALLGVLVRRLR